MNLSGLDLNLLVTFHALVEEGSVTRAAKRLGLSQPAASNALRRLRTLLDDPLLVRSGGAMVPTERALTLAGPVRDALGIIDRALSPPAFDPANATQCFHIATADLIEIGLMPSLLRTLRAEAPGVDLRAYSLPRGLPTEELERGRFDLAVGAFSQVPAGFHTEPLWRERFVCIVREDHPVAGKRLTPKRFADLGHVLVSPGGRVGGMVDRVLADHGLVRRVNITTPHFLVAPLLVLESDLICTIAERVAHRLQGLLPIRVLEPPMQIPSFGIDMVWHRRTHETASQVWLRERIRREAG